MLHDLLVDDFVHDLEAFDGLFLSDTDVLLLQRHGPERVVKVEQTLWVGEAAGWLVNTKKLLRTVTVHSSENARKWQNRELKRI